MYTERTNVEVINSDTHRYGKTISKLNEIK